jgi:tRNA threonylcarbamoyladenosine biosynthesis protein TsaE
MNEANASVISTDVSLTHRLAAALARQCRRGDCILLRGDLGAGKTTFARGFIRELQSATDEIVSPTFTLVQTYPTKDGNTVWHFDFYRLKNANEVLEIGLDEALHEGITLIEWPELAQSRLPEDALNVTIAMGSQPGQRQLTFTGLKEAWQARLDKMKENT